MAQIEVDWVKIVLSPPCRWRDVRKQIDAKPRLADADKAIYVVRILGAFAINYDYKASPVLYIGSGHLQQRLQSQLKWLNELAKRVKGVKLEIWFFQPRPKLNGDIRRDVEAELLTRFLDLHGAVPLFNARHEAPENRHTYVPDKALKSALVLGKEKSFQWALVPLPPNSSYKTYHRG